GWHHFISGSGIGLVQDGNKQCDLLNLDPSMKNVELILSERNTDRALEYYSKSLKENATILNGNFPLSFLRYNLLRMSRKMIK
ncbi:MAG: hypothetical protein WCI71_15055, partial [Bacteroidota bacterium]